MRAAATGGFGFGFEKHTAQFDQRIAAQDRREEQPVRLQRPPDLDQGARQIVDPVQRQCRSDQIERAIGKGQKFFIRHDRRDRRRCAGAAQQRFR